MITALSLPFSSLNSTQVVLRLGNGVDGSSLSLESVLPIFSSLSGCDTDNIFSDPPKKMHFQLCNEGGENLLRVFAMGDLERSPPQYDPSLLPTPENDLHPPLTVPVSTNAAGLVAMQDHAYLDYDEFDLNYSTMCDRFPESHPSENSQGDTAGDIRNLFDFDVESSRALHDCCSHITDIIPPLYGSQAPPTNQNGYRHRILPRPASMLSSPTRTTLSSSSTSVAGSPFLASSPQHSPSQANSMLVEDDLNAIPKTRACKRRKLACTFPGCNLRFTSNYTLKLHVDAHSPKERLWFPCTAGCPDRFSRQHDRLRHEVAKHGKVCEWACSDCDRFFSSNRTLAIHKCPNGLA